MKKIVITILTFSSFLFGGGAYSLTMMKVGTGIIDPAVESGMSIVNNRLEQIMKTNKERILVSVKNKNESTQRLLKTKDEIAKELIRIKVLEEKINFNTTKDKR
jgi:hypothetical protein